MKVSRQRFGESAASPASSSGEHTGRGILRGVGCRSSCVLPRWDQVGVLFGERSDCEEAAEGTGCVWERALWGLQCMCETQLTVLIRCCMSQAWETAFLQTAAGKSPISSSSHAALAHPKRGRPSCQSLPQAALSSQRCQKLPSVLGCIQTSSPVRR